MRQLFAALCLTVFVASLCSAGEAPKPNVPPKPVKKPGDKKAVEMDYGPCLAATVGIAKDNIAYKGVLISLNKERTANVLFDTELMRVTAAWTGGYLNWASRAFADNNNDYCTAAGEIQFSTSRLPGWGKDGKFEDPRNPKDGPLPADWAKYKGLYLNGDKVVLSYTVQGVPVLESFASQIDSAKNFAFRRMLEVGASPKPLELFVMEGERDQAVMYDEIKFAYEHVQLWSATEQTFAIVDGGPPDTKFATRSAKENAKHQLVYLKIPSHEQPIKLNLSIERQSSVRQLGSVETETPLDIYSLTKGGPARWTQIVETKECLRKTMRPMSSTCSPRLKTIRTNPGCASRDSISSPMAARRFAPGMAMSGSFRGLMRNWRLSNGNALPLA